jgi:hypothetical protein
MNKKQVVALWCCIAVLMAILMFPPWRFVIQEGPGEKVYIYGGHSFVFSPPPVPITEYSADGKIGYFLERDSRVWNAEINYSRLLLPTLIVVLVCGGLLVSFRSVRQ